jgi:hypothetical protein
MQSVVHIHNRGWILEATRPYIGWDIIRSIH